MAGVSFKGLLWGLQKALQTNRQEKVNTDIPLQLVHCQANITKVEETTVQGYIIYILPCSMLFQVMGSAVQSPVCPGLHVPDSHTHYRVVGQDSQEKRLLNVIYIDRTVIPHIDSFYDL